MDLFTKLTRMAQSSRKTIVFPEGEDERVLKAALRLQADDILTPILLGDPAKIADAAQRSGLDLGTVKIQPIAADEQYEQFCQDFVERRHGKNTLDQAKQMLLEPSYYGTMMVYEHLADGMVSGAAHSTANTVRPALQIIKTVPGQKRVSGAMLLERGDERYVFADCAMNIDPDSATLAEIAVQSADTAKLIGLDPVVAMLSFSTKGSAKGEMVSKVQDAVALARELAPTLKIDGELQFDAAFVPEVGERKAPGSQVAGHANVFVFPELQSANIGYKIAQRLGNFSATGPVLQGLAAPVNDLSRGASSDDVYRAGILTAAQANMKAE
ncbi:MAG: phosphate acetyltransferase [Lactobacillus sp.]|jgi:phosphate acetyltransferase|nr:phosphate acetyltransferase [Lactobacillus sp.]MCI1883292.1 phosphate acetyltransferase [Lactobacillus sp.]